MATLWVRWPQHGQSGHVRLVGGGVRLPNRAAGVGRLLFILAAGWRHLCAFLEDFLARKCLKNGSGVERGVTTVTSPWSSLAIPH